MKILNKKAFSVLEYTILFVIIIWAIYYMRNYIQHGIYSLWGQSGQSFAYGRQYDPQKTVECSFDQQSQTWYDPNCVAAACAGSGDSAACIESTITGATCSQSYCTTLN